MRYCLYGHFAAVVVCILLSAADRRGWLGRPEETPLWLSLVFAPGVYLSLLTWMIGPFVVLAVLIVRQPPWRSALMAIGAEAFLWMAQTYALLPMVQ